MANSSISDLYASGSYGITTSTAIQGKNAESLTMDDFFKLLSAQMTNQDMMNPQENTDFIAQMAQFSSLQAMNNLLEYQQTANATSYVGKEVTIAQVNETTGKMESIMGVVENVTFYNGKPQVVVNGEKYDVHKIMQVNNPNTSGNVLNQVASYIGQTVTLTDTTDPDNPKDLTGVVSSVTLKGGKPYVIVDGKDYPASAITFVGDKGDYDYNIDIGNNNVDENNVDGTGGENNGLDTDDDIDDDLVDDDITDNDLDSDLDDGEL